MPMTFLDESDMDGGVSIPPQSSKPGSTRFLIHVPEKKSGHSQTPEE